MAKIEFKPAVMKEGRSFYPRIKFYTAEICDSYFLNKPCGSRGKALAKAKKYIKKITA